MEGSSPRGTRRLRLRLVGARGVMLGKWAATGAAVVLFVLAAAGGAWLAVATDDSESAAGQVDCWDGGEAPSAAECPLPTGPAGLASVFPSLRPGCADRGSAEGKAEVFVCRSRGLVIRYSRWDPFHDRVAYFHDANPQAFVATWRPGGVDAGAQWTSRDPVS